MGNELNEKKYGKKRNRILVLSALVLIIVAVVVLFSAKVICFHEWSDATCKDAKKCSLCDKERGKPLGHEADKWEVVKEPTCYEFGRKHANCIRCNEELTKDVAKTEHSSGEWVITEEYVINSTGTVTPGTESLLCSVCEAVIKTREYSMELTTSQKNAVIKAYDMISWWHTSYDGLITALVEFEYFSYDDAEFAVSHMNDIDWNQQAILFAKENASGASKGGLTEMMQFEKFSEEQIEKALKEVGY